MESKIVVKFYGCITKNSEEWSKLTAQPKRHEKQLQKRNENIYTTMKASRYLKEFLIMTVNFDFQS